MLVKSMNLLKNNLMFSSSTNALTMLGLRGFASKQVFSSDKLSDNFSFPKHKEFFNDTYYDTPSNNGAPGESPYASKAAGPDTMSEDYVDPNNPFVSESPFIPGGILAHYKKRAGLTADDVMEQGYWDKVRDLSDTAADYFDVVGKSDRDMMNQTKNYTTRLRLNRQVDFTEDFRKRFMTREYGNYQKYDEGKNTVTQVNERGEDDFGHDMLMKNDREMTMRLNTTEGVNARDQEEE